MAKTNQEKEFVEVFRNTGLNYKDALIYYTLITFGSKGCTVEELTHLLPIKRTTIYSILSKLIKLKCVKEGSQSEGLKKATIFVANKPEIYFNQLISKNKKEIQKIEKIKQKYSEQFDLIYQRGIEYSYDELSVHIKPYLKFLLDKGWKVVKYSVKEEMFGFMIYECLLHSPLSKFMEENGFTVLKFDFNVEEDKHPLKLVINGLIKEAKEMLSFKLRDFQVINEELEFFNKKYPAFSLKAKIEDLKKSKSFPKISDFLIQTGKNDLKEVIDVKKYVVIPSKEKVFCLWAESLEILNEMVEVIFKVERI